MKSVKMTRRFAGLFFVFALSLSLLMGLEAWREWQNYRESEQEYQHFQLSGALIELIEGLQYERLLTVRYLNTVSETTQTSVMAELSSVQNDNNERFDILTSMSEFANLSPELAEMLKQVWSEKKQIRQEVVSQSKTVIQEVSFVIDYFIEFIRQEFLLYGDHAFLSFANLYHSISFSESLGQLRSLGTKMLLSNDISLADLMTWAQLWDRMNFFFPYFSAHDTLQTQVNWQSLLMVNQQLIALPDLFEDVQVVFVSLNEWSSLMDENHRYVQNALIAQIKGDRALLVEKMQYYLGFGVLMLFVWIGLIIALWWVYLRWVVRGFVGSFIQLQAELGQVVQRVDNAVFQPICLPDTCLSQEIRSVLTTTNELLTQVEFKHYVLTEQSNQLVDMVQAVIEVMTKVNRGYWDVSIELPAEGQLAQLKDTINSSIQYIKLTHQATLHQERLTVMGNMATSLAHEINNPIAGILMNLEYLKTLPQADEEAEEIIEETLTAVLRMRKLILSMLSFGQESKSTLPQDEVQSSCMLKETLDSVMQMSRALAKRSGVMLSFDSTRLEAVNCHLAVSTDKLELVLFSLITHVVQVMTETPKALGHPLELSIDYFRLESSRQLLIRITDSLPKEQDSLVAQMMDPFFVSKQGSVEDMGLQRSMQLVREIKGNLTIDESYVSGTRFLLYLPMAQSSSAESDQPLISEARRKELTRCFGDDAYEQIFDRYVTELPQSLIEIREAFEGHAMQDAKYLAHNLKGSSLGLGVDIIANICAELEVLAMKAATDPQTELLTVIFARLDKLSLALQAQSQNMADLTLNTPPPLRKS